MSYFGSTDWHQRASAGEIPGVEVVQNVGFRDVGTALEPLNSSGFYRTPSTAPSLELVSSSADDSAAGVGARVVRVRGLDATWAEATELVTTNGTTPVALATSFIRIYRVEVEETGVYAEALLGSHVGTITIQEAGGGAVWSEIPITPHPLGRALISCYSVPINKFGFVSSVSISADTIKTVNVIIAFRSQADVVASPFGARRTGLFMVGVSGPITLAPRGLVGPVPGPADIIVLGQAEVGLASLTVNVEILTVDSP